MISILLVDDEIQWLNSFRRTLVQYGVSTMGNIFIASGSDEACQILSKNEIDIVFLDLVLEKESGEDILKKIKSSYPGIMIVIMTGVNNVQSAVNCIKYGASDYLVKTMSIDELITSVKRVVKMCELEKDNIALRQGLLSVYEPLDVFKEFITISPKIISIFKYLTAIAGSSQSVLITGESGVGKGVIAKAFAKLSRPDKPFVSFNVAGLDTQMFSDTLFGHVKGAFTGAESKRIGLIPQAKDGIVFLDEIGELPMQSQIKLLYITQDGEYMQLGSDHAVKTTARFIFATNQDLEQRQAEGFFRKDLFYRLNTHKIHIPPLRERPEDIPILLENFLHSASAEYNIPTPNVDDSVLKLLSGYYFPGNTRELRAMAYDAAAKSGGAKLTKEIFKDYLVKNLSNNDAEPSVEPVTMSNEKLPKVDEVVNDLIERAMKLSGNNQTKAAALIGLSQSTLSRRLKN